MEITPASAVQVADSGELIEIGDDVLGVARRLREIDPSLRLRYSETHNFWAVYQEERHPITNELLRRQLVTTMKGALDMRIVARIEKVTSEGYDLVAEMDRLDKQKKRDLAHARAEENGPRLERLAHAIRKDKGLDQQKVFIPRSLELPAGVGRP